MGQTVGRGKHRGRSSRLLCRVGARGPGTAKSQCTATTRDSFILILDSCSMLRSR